MPEKYFFYDTYVRMLDSNAAKSLVSIRKALMYTKMLWKFFGWGM